MLARVRIVGRLPAVRVATAVVAALTALVGLPLASPVPAATAATDWDVISLPARQADDVVDAYGVGIHTPFLDTPYADAPRVADALADLGVRHVRDDLFLGNPRQYDAIRTIARRGIAFDLIMGRPDRPGTPADYVRTVAGLPKGAVEAVEGINEWDHFGAGRDWVTETVSWQRQLYREVKRTRATAHLPVLSPALAFRRNYPALPDLSPWSDVANAHVYPGGYKPGTELGRIFDALRAVISGKPLVTTEAGYHNATNTTNGHNPASERAAGLYLPRLLLEHYTRGHARLYSYELIDEFHDPAKVNPEAHFGLLRRDWSPKPAYTAMKTLLGLLADPGPDFATTPLRLKVDGWPSDGRFVVTQKRDGRYVVLLYRDVSVWDPQARRDLPVEAADVTLAFTTSYDMTVHRVSEGAAPVSRTRGTTVRVPVDGGVTAVTLTPPRLNAQAAGPTDVEVTSGDRSATVTWALPDRSDDLTAVRVKRMPDGVATRVDPAAGRWTDTGLVNGKSYRYKLRALSPSGRSRVVKTPEVVPATVPGKVRITSARVRGTRLTVSWSAAAARGRPIERYRVTHGTQTVVVAPTTTEVTVRRVPRAVPVTVQARNARGWGRVSRARVQVS
ncbi:hypothetical protein [Nocardioides sp. SYSU DS0663]|uniref:hypothetical protein n=1 Tax=Nocardioides sp. SYSU DS0663 TaxID=3416445 RepID=UPI003F4B4509